MATFANSMKRYNILHSNYYKRSEQSGFGCPEIQSLQFPLMRLNFGVTHIRILSIIWYSFLIITIGCKEKTVEPDALPTSEIEILKFWSEQFVTTTNFNYLQGGAGSSGNDSKKILMGTRNNSTAYAGALITVSNSTDLNLVKVRFCIENNSGISLYGDGDLHSNVASVSMFYDQNEEIPAEYSLVAWIDGNGNHMIDNNESYILSDGKFIIVNNNIYGSRRDELVNLMNLSYWTFVVPRARAFFKAFLLNEPIEYGGTNNSSPIQFNSIEPELQQSLNYKVGVDLNSSGLETIRNFFFGSTTELANDIIDSDSFHRIIDSLLNSNMITIRNAFPAVYSFVFQLPQKIIFPFNSAFGSIDFDLYRVFHEAQLSGDITVDVTCDDNNHIVLSSLLISGTILDLYDFDYQNVDPLLDGHKAALVQAGYATIGNAGGIFRTQVDLNTIVLGHDYDFGSCAPAGECDQDSYPNSMRWRIEEGGNGHLYEVVFVGTGTSWDQAQTAAEARGGDWHLATITSAAENNFVESLFSGNPGIFNCCHYPVPLGRIAYGPWIGAKATSNSSNDWTWVTGEPFSFTDWGPYEPFGNGNRIAYCQFGASQVLAWNDMPSVYSMMPLAYILECSGNGN